MSPGALPTYHRLGRRLKSQQLQENHLLTVILFTDKTVNKQNQKGAWVGVFFFLFCFFIASQDQAFSSPSNMMGEQGKFALLNEINVCFGLHSAGGGGGGGGYSVSSSFPKSRLSMLLPCPWMVTVEMQRRRCVVG